MTFKNKVQRCFNNAVTTYEDAADIQHLSAKTLAEKLPMLTAKTILEIGCGTGLFSSYLSQSFKASTIVLTDIAEAMVSQCQKRFSEYPNISFACMDGEALSFPYAFDLIISNMTLHWFTDLKKSLQCISETLMPGGQFIFAMLGDQSLQEWRHLCASHNLSIPTPDFPVSHDIQNTFPGWDIHSEIVLQHYQNPYDFLTTLKSLGAHAAHPSHEILSASKLRRILKDRTVEAGMQISYEIIYGRYIKT